MSDLSRLLESESESVDLLPGGFERLLRRRDRKHRNQRIAAAVVALILAIAAIGGAIRVFQGAERQIPASGITSNNVKDLKPAWSAEGFGAGTPVVADGVVYVGSQEGRHGGTGEVRAYPTSCADPCQPLWVASTKPGTQFDVPTVSGGEVYATNAGSAERWGPSQGRELFAFPTDCPNPCRPNWIADVGGVANPNLSPAVSGGVVYVPSEDGHLYAFSTTCGSGGATCDPLWTGSLGGSPGRAIAIAGGTVYVGTGGLGDRPGELFAFPTSCRTSCRPLWNLRTENTVWDLAAAGDRLIVGMVWSVVAYPLDCATAKACLPIWKGRTRSGYHLTNGPPATAVTVAGDTVFVNQRGGLFALSAQCGWCRGGSTGGFGLIGSARPAVAGGVVYVGLNYGGIRAFPAHCNWPCLPPAWEGQVGPLAPSFVSVTATQDAVYAGTSGSFTRGLHVFSLADPAVRPKVASFSEGSDDSAIVFYVGLAVAALLLLGRARREKKMGAG